MEHAKKEMQIYYVKSLGMECHRMHFVYFAEPSGDGAFRAMKNAIIDANLSPGLISYINAHSTSTPSGDEVEVNAIDKILVNRKKN